MEDAALAPQIVSTRAVFAGLQASQPVMLTFYKRLHRAGGREKLHSQMVPVHDPELIQRLQTEVRSGDEIEVTIFTDWSKPDLPTHLVAFSRVSSSTGPAAAKPRDKRA